MTDNCPLLIHFDNLDNERMQNTSNISKDWICALNCQPNLSNILKLLLKETKEPLGMNLVQPSARKSPFNMLLTPCPATNLPPSPLLSHS